MTYWCELAWLGGDVPVAGVLLEVRDGHLEAVHHPIPVPPDRAEVLPGLTLPGLANAHSHAFHRGLRGRTQRPGTFWSWREQMYALAARLTPEGYLRLARAVYAEMAQCGYTVVGEFHYLHQPPEMEAAVVEAASGAGIRLTFLDTLYLSGGFGAPLSAEQRGFADPGAAAWRERLETSASLGPRARRGAAIHSVRAVDPPGIDVAVAWAEAHAAPLHAHVSEQPTENERCLAVYGVSPTQLLADHGALGPRFTAVHATHLSATDVALLGASGSTCCLCPTTERDLADGIGPSSELRAAGAVLSLGSDSHAVVDPFEEARALELDERLRTLRRGHHRAPDLLTMATSAGYASLGWPDGGRLAPGRLADFVTLGLDSVRLAGTPAELALDAVVFGATASDVQHVVIGGEPVVRGGRHQRLDVAAELAEAMRAR